jgi:hypothetical protein
MRKLSFASLLSKKKGDAKLSEAELSGLRRQACLTNEQAPRLRAAVPSTSNNRDPLKWGVLVIGPETLFYFVTTKEDVQFAVPDEPDVICLAALSSIASWMIDERKCFVVTTENGSSFHFVGDPKDVDVSLWGKECMAMLDAQMLNYQRSLGGKTNFLFAFLENTEDFGALVESEPSLKELASEETLLFDVRMLQKPDSLSADSLFFAGQRFVARWSLGSRKTPVILIVDPNQGICVCIL